MGDTPCGDSIGVTITWDLPPEEQLILSQLKLYFLPDDDCNGEDKGWWDEPQEEGRIIETLQGKTTSSSSRGRGPIEEGEDAPSTSDFSNATLDEVRDEELNDLKDKKYIIY